jgi:hypothetical protein
MHRSGWIAGDFDGCEGADAALARSYISNGVNVLVKQARAALPNAYILPVLNAPGRSMLDGNWENRYSELARITSEFVQSFADDKVIVVPTHAFVNRDAGCPVTISSTDNVGRQSTIVSDATHENTIGMRQYAEVVAQYIAALTA